MMKKLIPIISFLLIATTVWAAGPKLAWDYTDSSNLTGWVCYYQDTADTSKTYTYTLNEPTARTLDLSVLQLTPGTEYNFWLTAYNAQSESDPSNTVNHTTEAWTPPADSHPVTITITAPATVTITQP